MMLRSLIALAAGFILDLMIGDPHELWHPVQGIGALISVLEKYLRRWLPKTKQGERIAGGILVILVLLISAGIPALMLLVAAKLNRWLALVLETIFCYQLLATKSLKTESRKVYTALQQEGLAAGRKAVSMIVGRDTENLSEEGVVKAAVETVAENTSDGIIAPMLYMAIGGAVLGFFYKAVNTMDSMIGYKNDRYQYFGTCAARLDDIVNYIPARISAILMLAASVFCRMQTRNALRIYLRDRHNHKSPNAAQTEAVMAGALGVQLAGNAYYFGTLHEKPTIGDPGRCIEREDILRADLLLYATATLAVVLCCMIKFIIILN